MRIDNFFPSKKFLRETNFLPVREYLLTGGQIFCQYDPLDFASVGYSSINCAPFEEAEFGGAQQTPSLNAQRIAWTPSHIYKYKPFGYSTFFLFAHHDFCLPLSSCSSQSSLFTLFCRRLLGLSLLRTPCLQDSGFLPLLQRPTSGDIKMRDCFPVMAVVFLAQVRLNLALGMMNEFFFYLMLIGDFIFLLILFSWISLLSPGRNCITLYPTLSPFCPASFPSVKAFLV